MKAQPTKKLDDQIKEAEIERIKAETDRIEEEKLKIEFDRRELERKLRLPWYKSRAFFQVVVAGSVAIPLIWSM